MTPYEQLRARINELLPDRIALDFGCLTNPTVDSVHFVLRELITGQVEAIELVDDEGEIVFSGKKKIWPRRILGKPLIIADVLRVLNLSSLFTLSSNGILYRGQNDTPPSDICSFDLTKPLSAPENDEACGKVLELLSV